MSYADDEERATAGIDLWFIPPGESELEWPPRSGRTQAFPEIDRAAWFPLPLAHEKIILANALFLIGWSRCLSVSVGFARGRPPSRHPYPRNRGWVFA